jgi:ParB family chromosome partitioning protein
MIHHKNGIGVKEIITMKGVIEMETERSYEANLRLDQIQGFVYQRKQVNEEKLGETIENIKTKGVIEPIIVRKVKEGNYQLVAGYLRFLSAQKAGFETIPSIVYKELGDLEATDILMIENLHRQELSDLDEANILNMYVKEGLQQKDIAERLTVSPSYVSLKLKLLEDKEPLREAISKGTVTEPQARMLRVLPNTKALKEVIPEVEGKTVKETREIVTEAQAKYVKDSLKEQIKDYKKKIEDIAEFEKQRDSLQNGIDKLQGEIKALKTDDKEINRNIKKIMELESKYFPALDEITKLQAQINDLRKTRPKNVDEFVNSLEKERKEVYEKQAKLKAQIDDLNEKLKTLRNDHKKLEEQASALTQQITKLKAEDRQFTGASERIESLKELVANYEKSHKSAIDNFEQLKAKVEAADKEILAKRTEIAEKIALLSRQKQALNGKIANKKNYQEAIEVLEKKLKSL